MSGCTTAQRPRATINDCVGGGYRIVAVDGKSEVRAQHPVHTVVPVVVVEPGRHTFTIQPDGSQETFEVLADITADRSYCVSDLVGEH